MSYFREYCCSHSEGAALTVEDATPTEAAGFAVDSFNQLGSILFPCASRFSDVAAKLDRSISRSIRQVTIQVTKNTPKNRFAFWSLWLLLWVVQALELLSNFTWKWTLRGIFHDKKKHESQGA